MAEDFTEESAADAVAESFAGTPDERLAAVLNSLVRHLHGFVRDVEPTIAEWEQAIAFLTATGAEMLHAREEFILLSDVLGVSMLVEMIERARRGRATQSPCLALRCLHHRPDWATDRPGGRGRAVRGDGPGGLGGRHAAARRGAGRVAGRRQGLLRRAGAGGQQPPGNGRGLFTADAGGRFWFRTIVPSYYPIPTDSPVGALLLPPGGIPTGPRTSTSSSRPAATAR